MVVTQTQALRSIVTTISSLPSWRRSSAGGEYCVSKAGLAMLTKLFALRLATLGIGVFGVRPWHHPHFRHDRKASAAK